MSEQELIITLKGMVGWAASIIVGLIIAVYGWLVWYVRKLDGRVDNAVTQEELEKAKRELHEAQNVRHAAFEQRMDTITQGLSDMRAAFSDGIRGVHGRMDQIYTLLISKQGGGS